MKRINARFELFSITKKNKQIKRNENVIELIQSHTIMGCERGYMAYVFFCVVWCVYLFILCIDFIHFVIFKVLLMLPTGINNFVKLIESIEVAGNMY